MTITYSRAAGGLAGLFFALALASQSAQAAFVQSTNAAAAGFTTATTITFSEFGIGSGTVLTNQYSSLGVTFSPNLFQDPQPCSVFPNFAANCVGNFNSTSVVDPFDIHLSGVQTQAGFTMTWNPGTSILSAYLGPALIESVTVTIDSSSQTNNFFGFTGISFDRITIDVGGSNNSMIMDNLTLNAVAVPEPGTLALLGLALAGLGFSRRRKLH